MKQLFIPGFLCLQVLGSEAQAASAAYVRSLSRNTSNDAADIALYNPAVSALKQGCSAYISNLSVHRDWDIRADEARYDTKVQALIVPEFHLTCGFEKLGLFVSLYPTGGAAQFDKGLPSYIKEMNSTLKTGIQNQSLQGNASAATLVNDPRVDIDAQKINAHYHLGAAYALSSEAGVALGLQQVYSSKKVLAHLHFDTVVHPSDARDYSSFQIKYHQDAFGVAPIAAIAWQSESWRSSLRYEAAVPLKYRSRVQRDDTRDIAEAAGMEPVVIDGSRFREDRPASLNLGLGYSLGFMDIKLDGSYLFNRESKSEGWQSTLNRKAVIYNNPGFGQADQRKNAWTAASGLEGRLNASWLASAGIMYNSAGSNKDINVDEQHQLNAYLYGLGAQYHYSESTNLDFGYLLIDSIDSFNQDETEVYRMRDQVLAFGLNYRS